MGIVACSYKDALAQLDEQRVCDHKQSLKTPLGHQILVEIADGAVNFY